MDTKFDPAVAASITQQGQSIINQLAERVDLLGDFTPTKIQGRYAGTISVDAIEQFAMEIVKECMACCERVVSDPVPKGVDTWTDGGMQCYEEIKHHFGITK